jgi:plastocyanin domain-containing protein
LYEKTNFHGSCRHSMDIVDVDIQKFILAVFIGCISGLIGVIVGQTVQKILILSARKSKVLCWSIGYGVLFGIFSNVPLQNHITFVFTTDQTES